MGRFRLICGGPVNLVKLNGTPMGYSNHVVLPKDAYFCRFLSLYKAVDLYWVSKANYRRFLVMGKGNQPPNFLSIIVRKPLTSLVSTDVT